MLPVRVILFDFGDTLVHFGALDRAAMFRRAAARTYWMWARRQRRMPDFRRYYLHQWFAIHWGLFKMTVSRREVDVMRLLRRACKNLWLRAPEPFIRELVWQWYEPLAESAYVEPGTHGLLAQLRARGVRLGIVSNTFVPGFVLDRHLQELNLLEFFPDRIYSCDVGYRKPDRRIFESALARFGASPEQALFVGDQFTADVQGARRAGLHAVWKRRLLSDDVAQKDQESQEDGPATPTIQRLIELADVFDGMTRRAVRPTMSGVV